MATHQKIKKKFTKSSQVLAGHHSFPDSAVVPVVPVAKHVTGNTDLGYEARYHPKHYPVFIATTGVIPELREVGEEC